MMRRRRLAGLIALTLVLVGRVQAQQLDSTRRDTTAQQLQTIEVTGSIVPTAGPTIGSGVPARISTVTGEALESWEPRMLPDALETQAGVTTYDDVGSAYKISLNSRGFSASPALGTPQGVSVFLNGVRQNEPDASEVNFDLMPLDHIAKVELLSGSASLLGPNSLGGAINLITQRGSGPPGGEMELTGGMYGTYEGEASVNGSTRNNWDYYVAGGYGHETGWRDFTQATSYNGFLSVGHTGKNGGVHFWAMGARSRVALAGSLPEEILDTNATVNFTPGDYEKIHEFQGAFSGYQKVGANRFSLTVYGRTTNSDRFNSNQVPDPNARFFGNTRVLGATGDWRWTRALNQNTSLSVRLGVDAARTWTYVQIYNLENDGTLPPDQLVTAPATITTDAQSSGSDAAGYGLVDLKVGPVTLSGGARYDYVKIPFTDKLDPTNDTSSSYHRLNPRVGASVDLGHGVSVYGSWGESFRAPNLIELTCADPTASCPLPNALGADPPLDPVIAKTVEGGARLVASHFILDGSAYRTTVDNDIYFIANSLIGGYFANIGATRREGIELSGQAFLPGGHTVYANYAYTRGTFEETLQIFSARADADRTSPLFGANIVQPGDHLPSTPANTFRTGASFKLPAGLTAGLDIRYTGPQWLRGDEANETSELPGYSITNARLGWAWKGWSILGIVSNVFDTKRAVFGTFNRNETTDEVERFLTPAQARQLKVVVRRSFGAAKD
jgi:outer membrane receptor protein involved in Fe transport